MGDSYNFGVDAQRNSFLALFALGSHLVVEYGYPTTFSAHKHIALFVDDKVELSDKNVDVTHEAFYGNQLDGAHAMMKKLEKTVPFGFSRALHEVRC